MAWEYKRNESAREFTTQIPEGNHRIRIKSAEKAVSTNGNDMITLQFDVSGFNETIYHHITFLQDRPEITNRNLTRFFDAFKDIADGEFDMSKWIGKVGACAVKHEGYNGKVNSKVDYFIHADKQSDLPAWVEPSGGNADDSSSDEFMQVNEADLPW